LNNINKENKLPTLYGVVVAEAMAMVWDFAISLTSATQGQIAANRLICSLQVGTTGVSRGSGGKPAGPTDRQMAVFGEFQMRQQGGEVGPAGEGFGVNTLLANRLDEGACQLWQCLEKPACCRGPFGMTIRMPWSRNSSWRIMP
jgi:hypothetical protein